MTSIDIDKFGSILEDWVYEAPNVHEIDELTKDAQDALIQADMVQYNRDGWSFKLHEKHPNAPKSQFKLMIREAPGVDTNPLFYDRFVLPSVIQAGESGLLQNVNYVLGYPNAGTPIASAFVRLADIHLGIDLEQLRQEKITHYDGRRVLGDIISNFEEGGSVLAVDDTTIGGDTKIEGWNKIIKHSLGYAGLVLIVERDPLGTRLVEDRTNTVVKPSMHWITLVQRAAANLDLPIDAIQKEVDYSTRLLEWNIANNNASSFSDPDPTA